MKWLGKAETKLQATYTASKQLYLATRQPQYTNPEHALNVDYEERQVDGIRQYDLQPFARALESVGVPLAACALIFDVIYPVGSMSRLLDDDTVTDAFVEIVIVTEAVNDDDDRMEMDLFEAGRPGGDHPRGLYCMDQISSGSEVFHGECILTWLHNSSSCPLCCR